MAHLQRTYAENIRMAAKLRGFNIRTLANASGFSYEHIRKIWMGRTPKRNTRLTISPECNERLCILLELPAEQMFDLAEREKYMQKHGYAPIQLPDPLGQELMERWAGLSDDQKQIIVRMAQSFAVEFVRTAS